MVIEQPQFAKVPCKPNSVSA